MSSRSRVPRSREHGSSCIPAVEGAEPYRTGGALRPVLLALPIITILSACSSHPTEAPRAEVAPGAYYPRQVAAGSEEMEADGLPAQRPPLQHRRPTVDDPSEPFSPNYGSSVATADSKPAVTRTSYRSESRSALGQKQAVSGWRMTVDRALPDDLPPGFRRRLVDSR